MFNLFRLIFSDIKMLIFGLLFMLYIYVLDWFIAGSQCSFSRDLVSLPLWSITKFIYLNINRRPVVPAVGHSASCVTIILGVA